MFKKDIIAIMIAGVAVIALLAHYAIKGQEIPLGPALAVAVVNVLAAWRLFVVVKKAKEQAHRKALEAADRKDTAD